MGSNINVFGSDFESIYILHQTRVFCLPPENTKLSIVISTSFRQLFHVFQDLQRKYPFIPSKTGGFIFSVDIQCKLGTAMSSMKKKVLG